MSNSKTVYNDFVRANLPGYIRYDSVRNQYVTANGKRFVTYLEAKWYTDYIIKNGSIIDRAIGNNIPQVIADFSVDKYASANKNLGPELVTNGTFDTDTSGWTATRSASLALVSNTIEVTGTGTTQSAASQGITTTIGETYVVSFDFVSETGTARFAVSSQDNLNTAPDILNNLSLSAGQSYTFTFKANATTTYLHLASAGATDVTSWDNVSVREVVSYSPASTTAASLLTHTRAGTATYTDSTGTLQTAATNELRKDNHIWDGSSWVKRCLVEPQSTNLVTYSQDFTDASWTKTKANVAGTAQGPDGVSDSATILSDDSSTGTGTVFIFDVITTTVSTAYTYSLFAKADQLSWVRLQLGGFTASGGTETAYFNLSDGTVGTVSTANLTAKIEDFGDGWYRCCVSFTSNASATSGSVVIVVADADGDVTVDLDGTSSILIYGAQFEASSVPTSYIPTSGSQVTRAADALSIDSTLLPYDSTAMTIAMEGEVTYADIDTTQTVGFFLWALDSNNRIIDSLWTNATNAGAVYFESRENAILDRIGELAPGSYSPGINVPFNIASRHTSSDINGAVDGTALTANTTPTALPDLSATDFEIAPTGVVNIKSLRILGGYGATDAELEAATVS